MLEDVGLFGDESKVSLVDGAARTAKVYVYDAKGRKIEAGRAHSVEAQVSAGENSGTSVHTYYYSRSDFPVAGLQGREKQSYKISATADTKVWAFPQPSMLFDMISEAGFVASHDYTFYQRGGLETSALFVHPEVELPEFLDGYDTHYWKNALAKVGKEPRLATSPVIELSYGIEPKSALRVQLGWLRWACTNGIRRFTSYGGYKSGHGEFDWKHLLKWLKAIYEGAKVNDYDTNVIEDGWAKPGMTIYDPTPRDPSAVRDIFMGNVEIMSAAALRNAAAILEASTVSIKHPRTNLKVAATDPIWFAGIIPSSHKRVLSALSSSLDKSYVNRASFHLNLLADSLEDGEPVYTGQLNNAISSAVTDARIGVTGGRNAVMVERMNDQRTLVNAVTNVAAYTWSESFLDSLANVRGGYARDN